jgi:hypothetical protein
LAPIFGAVGTADNHLYRLKAETRNPVAEFSLEATPVGRLAFTADLIFLFLENRSQRSGYIVALKVELGMVYAYELAAKHGTYAY